MNHNFLYQEYTECFNQLRYIDGKHITLLKFGIILASSLSVAMMSIYQFFYVNVKSINGHSWLIFTFFSLVVFLGNTLIAFAMLKNRLYHTRLANQLNSLRNYFIQKECPGFSSYNQMYKTANLSPFRLLSVQMFMIMGILILAAIFFGFFIFTFSLYQQKANLVFPLTGGGLYFIILVFFFTLHLKQYSTVKHKKKGRKS